MPWAKLDDRMWAHPKFIGLSLAAVGLWASGLSYAAGYLTDGVIPLSFVTQRDGDGEAEELLSAGLWSTHKDGFVMHDWADYQPQAADVKAARRVDSARKSKARNRSTK